MGKTRKLQIRNHKLERLNTTLNVDNADLSEKLALLQFQYDELKTEYAKLDTIIAKQKSKAKKAVKKKSAKKTKKSTKK